MTGKNKYENAVNDFRLFEVKKVLILCKEEIYANKKRIYILEIALHYSNPALPLLKLESPFLASQRAHQQPISATALSHWRESPKSLFLARKMLQRTLISKNDFFEKLKT